MGNDEQRGPADAIERREDVVIGDQLLAQVGEETGRVVEILARFSHGSSLRNRARSSSVENPNDRVPHARPDTVTRTKSGQAPVRGADLG